MTMMAAAIAMMAVGTGVSAYSQYQQGQYQQDMADYQAKVTEQNAAVNAQMALEAGAEEDASFRKKARALQGTNIKNIAMSGVTMTGSPLLVMSEIAEEVEQESYGIRRSARVNAANSRYQGVVSSGAYRAQGQNAYSQGIMGGAGTLLKGGSKISSMYIKD